MTKGSSLISRVVGKWKAAENAFPADLVDFVGKRIASRSVKVEGDHGDGVLFNPNRGRENDKREATCKVVADAKLPEHVLTRAVFNSRSVVLPNDLGDMIMLSYEAALLRAFHGTDSREVSCDLVGLIAKGMKLVAVEVKEKTNEATDLDFAVVEAWVYRSAMLRHAVESPAALASQVRRCVEHYHAGRHLRLRVTRQYPVLFAVAAPLGYFKNQLTNRLSKVCSAHRFLQTCPVAEQFLGFLVIGKGGIEDALETVDHGVVAPRLRPDCTSPRLCRSLDELHSLVCGCR